MKLQNLAIGSRFEYEGKVYVKTGPITATSDPGGQRVIPRSATLKPLDDSHTGKTSPEAIDKATVLNAFNAFYQTCSMCLDASSLPSLETARQRFLSAINK
jgi:hypothetical protein